MQEETNQKGSNSSPSSKKLVRKNNNNNVNKTPTTPGASNDLGGGGASAAASDTIHNNNNNSTSGNNNNNDNLHHPTSVNTATTVAASKKAVSNNAHDIIGSPVPRSQKQNTTNATGVKSSRKVHQDKTATAKSNLAEQNKKKRRGKSNPLFNFTRYYNNQQHHRSVSYHMGSAPSLRMKMDGIFGTSGTGRNARMMRRSNGSSGRGGGRLFNNNNNQQSCIYVDPSEELRTVRDAIEVTTTLENAIRFHNESLVDNIHRTLIKLENPSTPEPTGTHTNYLFKNINNKNFVMVTPTSLTQYAPHPMALVIHPHLNNAHARKHVRNLMEEGPQFHESETNPNAVVVIPAPAANAPALLPPTENSSMIKSKNSAATGVGGPSSSNPLSAIALAEQQKLLLLAQQQQESKQKNIGDELLDAAGASNRNANNNLNNPTAHSHSVSGPPNILNTLEMDGKPIDLLDSAGRQRVLTEKEEALVVSAMSRPGITKDDESALKSLLTVSKNMAKARDNNNNNSKTDDSSNRPQPAGGDGLANEIKTEKNNNETTTVPAQQEKITVAELERLVLRKNHFTNQNMTQHHNTVRRKSAVVGASGVGGTSMMLAAGLGGGDKSPADIDFGFTYPPRPILAHTFGSLPEAVAAQLRQCPALRLVPTQVYKPVLRLGRGAYGETWLVEARPHLRDQQKVQQQQADEQKRLRAATARAEKFREQQQKDLDEAELASGVPPTSMAASKRPGGGSRVPGVSALDMSNNRVRGGGDDDDDDDRHEFLSGKAGDDLVNMAGPHNNIANTSAQEKGGKVSSPRLAAAASSNQKLVTSTAGKGKKDQQPGAASANSPTTSNQPPTTSSSSAVPPPPPQISHLASTGPIRLKNGYEIAASNAFVCKVINRESSTFSQVANEVNILANVAHPCIVAFIEGYVETGRMNLVMEYVDGGDLRKEIDDRRSVPPGQTQKRFTPEGNILTVFSQTCLAIEYLHRFNILHRDLKPENMIVSKKWLLKIADFGLAKQYETDIAIPTGTSFVGTPGYVAPEVWLKKGFTEKSDIFSLGCILYEMITLDRPFPSHGLAKRDEIPDNLETCERRPITRMEISRDLKELCDWLLEPDPANRPTALEVLRIPLIFNAAQDFVKNFARSAGHDPVDKRWAEILEDQLNDIKLSNCATSKDLRQERRSTAAHKTMQVRSSYMNTRSQQMSRMLSVKTGASPSVGALTAASRPNGVRNKSKSNNNTRSNNNRSPGDFSSTTGNNIINSNDNNNPRSLQTGTSTNNNNNKNRMTARSSRTNGNDDDDDNDEDQFVSRNPVRR